MKKKYKITFLLLMFICCGHDDPPQNELANGMYLSLDGTYAASLDKDINLLMLYSVDSQSMVDSIRLGAKIIIKGCPTMNSFECEIACYPLEIDSLKKWGKQIASPVIGPSGSDQMIICEKPANNTAGGGGLTPSTNDTTKYIVFDFSGTR